MGSKVQATEYAGHPSSGLFHLPHCTYFPCRLQETFFLNLLKEPPFVTVPIFYFPYFPLYFLSPDIP